MNFSKQIVFKNIVKIVGSLLVSGILIFLGTKWVIADIQAGKWTFTFIVQAFIYFLGVVSGIFLVRFDNWSDSFFKKIFDKIENALRGDDGEKQVKAELEKFLGNEYKIYSNIKLPNKNFDIDILIVEPYGLTVFEVKNWKDEVVFYEKYFERIKHKSDYKMEITRWHKGDPREQLERSCNNLSGYLKEQGINISKDNIRRAIVFVEDIATWKGNPHTFIISGLKNLKKYFDHSNQEKISASDYEKLKNLFEQIS